MGIWIRSQGGKKLVNVNELWRDTKSIYGCHNTSEDAGFILGTYADGSEAHKAMDMIQGFVEGPTNIQIFAGEYPKVFQMPPAGFSEEHGGD